MWKTVLGLFSGKNVIPNIMSGVDKAIFTNEERADLHLEFLKAYEPYKIAQRILAIMIISVWLFFSGLSLGTILVGGYIDNERIEQVGEDGITKTNDTFGYPALVILGFYFAGGAVEGVVRTARNKRKDDKSK